MKIFLVIGTTGQYEDNHSWTIVAYPDLNTARHHAKRAQQRADEIIKKAKSRKDPNLHFWNKIMEQEQNEFDPNFHCDTYYGHTRYFVPPNGIELIGV